MYYCNSCGSYVFKKIRKLADPCDQRTLAGALFLNNVSKGIFPKQPDSASSFSPEEQDTLTNIHNYIHINRCDDAHNIPIPVSSGEEEVEEDLYSQASPLISCDSGESD